MRLGDFTSAGVDVFSTVGAGISLIVCGYKAGLLALAAGARGSVPSVLKGMGHLQQDKGEGNSSGERVITCAWQVSEVSVS